MDKENSDEVPLHTPRDTSDDQKDQPEPIENPNPQVIEHSSTQAIKQEAPAQGSAQVIKQEDPPQVIEQEDPPQGDPPHTTEQEVPPHTTEQEVPPQGDSPHTTEQEVPQEVPPQGDSPHTTEQEVPQEVPPPEGIEQEGHPQGGPPQAFEQEGHPQGGPPQAITYGSSYAFKCTLGASLACLFLGFAMGVVSDALIHIDKDNRNTKRQVEYHTVILHVLSLFGAIIGGRISDRIGRRYTIMLAGVFLFVGSILTSFLSNNALLLSGRAVTQVGVSFAPMIATVYIAEVSPASSRGFLASFPQVSINLGTVLGYAFNYFTSKFHPNFGRLAMLIMGPLSPFLLIIIGICIMSESPRWLFMQGHHIDARHILLRISNSEEEVNIRLASIAEATGMPVENNNNVQVNMQSTGEGVWRDLLLHPIPIVRHMLACAIGIHLLQQGCGIDTLVLYSPRIFEMASITSYNAKLILTLVIQVLKALPILIPTFYLDKVGRKRLLLISIDGMIIGLVFLGISLIVLDKSETKPGWAVGMCIVSLLICVFFYTIGMGPITTVYSSEIFSLRQRAQGNAISVGLGGVMAIIILLLYKVITLGGVAFLFMAITLFAHAFVHRIMPETQGHTLEEMQQIFGILNWWRFRVEDATAQGADIEA